MGRLKIILALAATGIGMAIANTPVAPKADVASASTERSFVETIKRSIVFVEADCPRMDGDTPFSDLHGDFIPEPHVGTGFLIGASDPRLGDRLITYLVTNRHVAEPGIEGGKSCAVFRYKLQLDRKKPNDAGSYSEVGSFVPQWTFPTDPSVDLALTPIAIDESIADTVVLPSALLMSAADVVANKVGEGDSVMVAGLFVQLIQRTHSEPIIREGKIAMIPKEKIQTTLNSLGDIYLLDCHVFGGNSGSPVFVDLAGNRLGSKEFTAGYNFKLLGVLSGYVKESADFQLHSVASYAGTVDANSGIATMVPAQQVLDLLDTPALKEARGKIVSVYLKQHPSEAHMSPK